MLKDMIEECLQFLIDFFHHSAVSYHSTVSHFKPNEALYIQD